MQKVKKYKVLFHQRIFIFVLLIIFNIGCSIENRTPKGFPDEKEFARILAEVHFGESVVSQMRLKKKGLDDVANGCYHTVLSKYNLTQEQFDTIVAWYTSKPEVYTRVYDDVVAILTENEAKWQMEVKEIKDEIERQRALKEARNVWSKERRTISVNENDTVDRRLPFEIDVDTIQESGYRISAFYQFLKGNEVKKVNMEIITLFNDSSSDTISYRIPVTFGSRKSEVNVICEDSLRVLKLQGYLLNHDTDDVVNARIKNIEFEYLPLINDSVLIDSGEELLIK